MNGGSYLLDTHTFLWLNIARRRIPATVESIFLNEWNSFYLSAVSVWEIAQKFRHGKLPLPIAPELFISDACRRQNIVLLPFEPAASYHLQNLPLIHKDPFDRMLICQAIHHGLAILTDDRHIERYPIRTVW